MATGNLLAIGIVASTGVLVFLRFVAYRIESTVESLQREQRAYDRARRAREAIEGVSAPDGGSDANTVPQDGS